MTQPWSMARVASRRQLPKPRKMMGPVGGASWHPDNASVVARDPARMTACDGCGCHVCSCEPLMDNGPIEPIYVPHAHPWWNNK